MVDWTEMRKSLIGDPEKSSIPSRVKVPILPLAVMKFNRRAEDPQVTAVELGKIIETDSGLTAALLRHINSAAVGLSQKATSAQQAVGLLGFRETSLYLVAKAMERSMQGRESKLINLRNFWAGNLERAIFAREVARLLGADQDLAFSAGMLQDFLLPALTNDMFTSYYGFTEAQLERPRELVTFEEKSFGWNHALAAGQIMYGWDFPDDLICCVVLHHRGLKLFNDPQLRTTAAAAVAASSLMPDPLKQIPSGLDQLVKLGKKWKAFDLVKIANLVDQKFAELSPVDNSQFSFRRYCQKALAV
ncbi:HDOD domain protein [Symmachiella macrocystis]|uniref:HDOD domain protein n=1 Tax=Symmachiella macrocystis TaxID=2527985 RepID=A0A5C6B5Q9_9PLAN|nr:HDOD domain-containing protein [Symmachiella macrocystis]TWU07278.1 HDOD domain protein [Symmachiella macrocystis]